MTKFLKVHLYETAQPMLINESQIATVQAYAQGQPAADSATEVTLINGTRFVVEEPGVFFINAMRVTSRDAFE